MKVGPLLNAHAYLQVERPPLLWDIEVAPENEGDLIRALGLMIVRGLLRGNELGDLTLNASNVTYEEEDEDEDEWIPPGDYVALTISGQGDWGTEDVWRRGENAPASLAEIVASAELAGAAVAYIRRTESWGSITVFYPASLPVTS